MALEAPSRKPSPGYGFLPTPKPGPIDKGTAVGAQGQPIVQGQPGAMISAPNPYKQIPLATIVTPISPTPIKNLMPDEVARYAEIAPIETIIYYPKPASTMINSYAPKPTISTTPVTPVTPTVTTQPYQNYRSEPVSNGLVGTYEISVDTVAAAPKFDWGLFLTLIGTLWAIA